MNETEPRRLELTPELLDYARGAAIHAAKKYCPKFVKYDDVVQQVMLKLLSDPPKYDPSKGAKETTFLHTVVTYNVMKYATQEARHGRHYRQVKEAPVPDDKKDNPRVGSKVAQSQMRKVIAAEEADIAGPRRDAPERFAKEWTTKNSTLEDVLEYIHDESSRELCRVFMACDGNMSEVARRTGVSEGTIRYRLKVLGPKLIAAGFNPFSEGELQ